MVPCLHPLLALAVALGGGSTDSIRWDGQSYRRFVDGSAHLAFPIPLTQALVEAHHFGPQEAGHRMTDVLTLSGPDGVDLEIGVWGNPQRVELPAWVRANAPFLLTPDRIELASVASGGRQPAVRYDHPRTGQQFARRTAVVALGDRVVTVTCWNRDNARAAAIFERVVDGMEQLP